MTKIVDVIILKSIVPFTSFHNAQRSRDPPLPLSDHHTFYFPISPRYFLYMPGLDNFYLRFPLVSTAPSTLTVAWALNWTIKWVIIIIITCFIVCFFAFAIRGTDFNFSMMVYMNCFTTACNCWRQPVPGSDYHIRYINVFNPELNGVTPIVYMVVSVGTWTVPQGEVSTITAIRPSPKRRWSAIYFCL